MHPCLRLHMYQFEGRMGVNQNRRSSIPGLGVLQPSTASIIARYRMVPCAMLLRTMEKPHVNKFKKCYGIPSSLRFERRTCWSDIPVIPSLNISPLTLSQLTHVKRLFTQNPSPRHTSKLPLGYILLPTRSALTVAPGGLRTLHGRCCNLPSLLGLKVRVSCAMA